MTSSPEYSACCWTACSRFEDESLNRPQADLFVPNAETEDQAGRVVNVKDDGTNQVVPEHAVVIR